MLVQRKVLSKNNPSQNEKKMKKEERRCSRTPVASTPPPLRPSPLRGDARASQPPLPCVRRAPLRPRLSHAPPRRAVPLLLPRIEPSFGTCASSCEATRIRARGAPPREPRRWQRVEPPPPPARAASAPRAPAGASACLPPWRLHVLSLAPRRAEFESTIIE